MSSAITSVISYLGSMSVVITFVISYLGSMSVAITSIIWYLGSMSVVITSVFSYLGSMSVVLTFVIPYLGSMSVEEAKRLAAYAAIDNHVKNHQVGPCHLHILSSVHSIAAGYIYWFIQ